MRPSAELGFGAGDEHELRPGGNAIGQRLDEGPRRSTPQPLRVVDDDDEWPDAFGDRPLEARDHHAAEVDGNSSQLLFRPGLERLQLVELADDVGQEDGGVVVPARRGEPGDGPVVVTQPLRHERRLAEATAADHEDDGHLGCRPQFLDQPRPRNQPGPRADAQRTGRVRCRIVESLHHRYIQAASPRLPRVGGRAIVSDTGTKCAQSAHRRIACPLSFRRVTSRPTTEARGQADSEPGQAKLVLISLILVAAVANLNLAVANVALPDIGKAFDSSQTTLDMIAVGYSLGLAASVLYLGALGDRYGRKLMLILGVGLSIPACILAAWAPTDEVLAFARIVGGLSAGMAYPTTLALITALWSGQPRTRAIALWSAIGGAISALGPLTAGWLLGHFWWGSVFLVTLPLAAVALVMAIRFVPAHVNEATDPVDNLGGILSIVMVAGLVLAINFAPVPDEGTVALGLGAIAARRADRLRDPPAAGPVPALRPRRRRPADLLGRGARRHHRVRLADGRDVHRPAVPAERARVLTARSGRGDPAGRGVHGDRGAALGQARRSRTVRASRCSPATSSACSGSSPCCCSGRTAARTGRSGWATRSSASASGWRARRRRIR